MLKYNRVHVALNVKNKSSVIYHIELPGYALISCILQLSNKRHTLILKALIYT